MAYEIPAFPEVASKIVLSWVSSPERIASTNILRTGRSFTDPPGFRYSHLAYISDRPMSSGIPIRTIGVLPMARNAGYRAIKSRYSLDSDIFLMLYLYNSENINENNGLFRTSA
jgi:hypothetical protein